MIKKMCCYLRKILTAARLNAQICQKIIFKSIIFVQLSVESSSVSNSNSRLILICMLENTSLFL